MTITRAITIRSLWDYAILIGAKSIENRINGSQFQYRGRVAVHSSLETRQLSANNDDYWEEHLYSAHPHIFDCLNDPRIGTECRAAIHPGCIVGSVEILDCVPFDPAKDDPDLVFSETKYRPYVARDHVFAPIPRGMFAEGPFCLVLADPHRYATPVPCRGMLGLWGLPEEVQRLVTRAEKTLLTDPAEPARVDRYLLTEAAKKERGLLV